MMNKINLKSGATSLFDVQRWTFDVGRSSFKTTQRLRGDPAKIEMAPCLNDLPSKNWN
jgi:hypothetical protein